MGQQENTIVATDDFNEDPHNVRGSQTSESLVSEIVFEEDKGGGQRDGDAQDGKTQTAQEPKTPGEGESPATSTAAKKEGEGGDQAGPGKDDKRQHKPDPVQRRIDEMTYHRREAERQRDAAIEEARALRERLAKLEGGQGGEKPPGGPGTSADGQGATAAEQPPKPEDFEDLDEFLIAKAKYEAKVEIRKELAEKEAEQARKEAEARQAREREEAEIFEAERSVRYWDKLTQDKAKYPDFDEVVFGPASPFNDPRVNRDLVSAIIESDVPADLAYHFNKNPQEVARLSSMSPVQIGREIAVLEAQFMPAGSTAGQGEGQQPNKRQSRAPDPVNPVRPSAAHAKNVNELANDPVAYREWRNKNRDR